MSFRKYPKLRRPGHPETENLCADPSDPLVITEKFDGNNVRVTRDGDELRFGSRNTEISSDPDTVDAMFSDVVSHLQDRLQPGNLRALEEEIGYDNIVLFGENAVQHTIEDYYWEEIPQFQLFDVWVEGDDQYCDDDHWLDWPAVKLYAKRLGLALVPEIEVCEVSEFTPGDYEMPVSQYRPGERPPEGVVVRNIQTRSKAKIISDEFAEKHSSAKSKSNRDDDIGRFIDEYVTRRRVEKKVESLIDSPDYDYEAPVMEMMEVLATSVYEDVWAEGWHEIAYKNWELDIGEARSACSSKTASLLNTLMMDQTVVDPGTGETAGEHMETGDEEL